MSPRVFRVHALRLLAGTVVAVACLQGAAALASPESSRLVREGVADLARQDYTSALARFEAAVRADPADVEAVFYTGVAANRQGRFTAAQAALLEAQKKGFSRAELDFELGWSAMRMGRAEECVQRLERFESAMPGRGQTSEFLGRCYLALGQRDKAEGHLKEAVRRDPQLKPTVDLSMAAIEDARGGTAAARERWKSAAAADAPTGRALRELAGPPEPVEQPDKPLRLSVSLAGGYNDNVIGLGNTIPLPTDISRKSAAFLRLSAGAAYNYQLSAESAGTLGYALLLDRYDGISASDLNDHYVYGDLAHRLSDRMGFSLRFSDEYSEVGGGKFRNQVGVRPALTYRFTANSATEFAYSFSDAHYYAPVTPVFNRDGLGSVYSATHYFQLSRTPWSGALGATVTRSRTDGTDFSFDGYGLVASASYAFTPKISGTVGASYTNDSYKNPNSLAGAGFAYARDDDQTIVSAQVVGQVTTTMRWYVQAQRLRNNSNISFYEYKQNVVSAGLSYGF